MDVNVGTERGEAARFGSMSYFRNLTKTEAFAEYGAALGNRLNEYSAIAEDRSLVVECWGHLIERKTDGTWRYQINDLSSWTSNPNGKNLLKQHLRYAFTEDRPVRLVLATPKAGAKPQVAGTDGTKIQRDISIRKDFVGAVVALDDNSFVIDFSRRK